MVDELKFMVVMVHDDVVDDDDVVVGTVVVMMDMFFLVTTHVLELLTLRGRTLRSHSFLELMIYMC